MQQSVRSIKVSSSLAFRDLWHDKKITFCLIVSLASVIAPLLLLLGLKSGIINTMEERFLKDPLNREIRVIGHYKHDLSWFEKVKAHSETSFIIPKTRILNAQVDFVKNNQKFLRMVEIIPTRVGDPVLSGNSQFPADKSQVVISHTVAQKLGLEIGEQITMVISRRFQNKPQFGKFKVTIIGILPESLMSKSAVFVVFDLLLDVDDFKDTFAVLDFGISEGKPRVSRDVFASARVFSKSLAGVSILADFIRDTGVEVKTHAKEIENIQQTEKVLSFVVKVVAWVAILGGAISLAGFLIANVDRKRQHLAMIRLLGFSTASIALYPMIQSLVIASLGFVIAIAGYFFGAAEFDRVLGSFMQEQGHICQLSNIQILGAFFFTNLVVLGAAMIGGFRAIQIEPAETFRQQ
jgi:putative ABC transport system permease protein